jgi:hypothetical protein
MVSKIITWIIIFLIALSVFTIGFIIYEFNSLYTHEVIQYALLGEFLILLSIISIGKLIDKKNEFDLSKNDDLLAVIYFKTFSEVEDKVVFKKAFVDSSSILHFNVESAKFGFPKNGKIQKDYFYINHNTERN